MTDKAFWLSFIKGVARATLIIVILVIAILVLDVAGLSLYDALTGAKTFSSLWVVLVIEGVVMMFLGFLGTTVIPQAGTIGFPWSKSVRAAIREIREDRQRQVEFWVFVGIIGLILFMLGLLISSFFTT